MEWWELTACFKVYLKVCYEVPTEVELQVSHSDGLAIGVCQNRDMALSLQVYNVDLAGRCCSLSEQGVRR